MNQTEGHATERGLAYAAPASGDEEAGGAGFGSLLLGTLISPGETFRRLARRPTWLAPLIISMAAASASALVFNLRATIDWSRVVHERLEASGVTAPSDAVLAQQVELAERLARYTPLMDAAFVPLLCLAVSCAFALGLMLMAAKTTFKKVFSVVVWSYCAVSVVLAVVTIIVLLVREPGQVDPEDLYGVVKTNPSFLLSAGTGAALKALVSSFDLFSVWFLSLLTVGFAETEDTRKFGKGRAAAVVVGAWALWVVVKTGWAAAFGA